MQVPLGLVAWIVLGSLASVPVRGEGDHSPSGQHNDTTPLDSFKECDRLSREERWRLATDACKQAVQELEGSKDRDEFAESLLLLAEAQQRDENPWMALDAAKRVLRETNSSKHHERVGSLGRGASCI